MEHSYFETRLIRNKTMVIVTLFINHQKVAVKDCENWQPSIDSTKQTLIDKYLNNKGA